jgi:hypothetical protein
MSLELERERAVQALCSHFAQDHLTTQELELRFESVYRAASLEELRTLTQGLPALVPMAATTPLPTYTVAAPAPALPEKRYLAIMGEVRRQGSWSVPSRVKASCWMGAIRLDLREAEIPDGGVDIDATCVMGEVRIILPPGLHAEVDGMAIMGEFSDRTAGTARTLAAPAVRVRGEALMGAVRVETRLPNEGALAAWKRRLRGN